MGIVGARARADPGRRGFDNPPAMPQELGQQQQQQQPQPNKAWKSGKKVEEGIWINEEITSVRGK